MSNKNVLAGRYELLEKIGDGGMAIVYKAKDRLLKRFIAVKILKPEFVKDVKFIENFKRESHAAASLSHPNIVSIYDVGQEGPINYIVMELVTGEPLSDFIRERAPLDYKLAMNITKQIAHGLSAAHRNGIVHRDVKPHNILLTEDGIAKITDFGIAKAVSNTTIVDNSKENVMGSVHYFSPEQAKGKNVDAKSDIYSLGIVLFEMLTGKVPFDGDNPVTVALMQINEKMIRPSLLNDKIPPALENIILKATDKVPSNRFASAEEMIKAIDNVGVVNNVMGNDVYNSSIADSYGDDYDSDFTAKDYDDEDKVKVKKKKKPKKKPAKPKDDQGMGKKKKIIIGVAAIAILALIGAFVFGNSDKKDIEVPSFIEMTLEEAQAEAGELGLEVKVDEYRFSDEYEQDQIMGQDPEEGTMVAEGEVIHVDISKGTETGEAPSLIGKSEDEAKRIIKEYGFTVGSIVETEGSEEKGTVLEQDPGAGTILNQGDTINLVVSDGKAKEMGVVPNLIGMSKDAAKKALENEGFELGSVTEGVSSSYRDGEVMWQEYNSGTKLELGEAVNIKISRSKSSKIAIKVPFAEAANEVFYMSVAITDENGTRITPKEECHKSDNSKTIYVEGTGSGDVKVYFDDVEVMSLKVNFATGNVGE